MNNVTKQYQKGLVQRISYCVRHIYADEAIVFFLVFLFKKLLEKLVRNVWRRKDGASRG